jgi:hypothetical protein
MPPVCFMPIIHLNRNVGSRSLRAMIVTNCSLNDRLSCLSIYGISYQGGNRALRGPVRTDTPAYVKDETRNDVSWDPAVKKWSSRLMLSASIYDDTHLTVYGR